MNVKRVLLSAILVTVVLSLNGIAASAGAKGFGAEWSTYLGGSGGESRAQGVAVDAAGNVYVVGSTSASGWAEDGDDETLGGPSDAYLVKLSDDGEHLWSTYIGGEGSETGHAVAVGGGGVFVTGVSFSTGWAFGGYDTTNGGNGDIFVAEFSSSGELQWSTYAGGASADEGRAIHVDNNDNVVVTGVTGSEGWVVGGFDDTAGNSQAGFVLKLSDDGDHIWSTYISEGVSHGVGTDNIGSVYAVGNASQAQEAYITKLSSVGGQTWIEFFLGRLI